MSGKLIFVAGVATGYVLGSRAGRARYEQIKKNWLKVWENDAVQEKVEKVGDFAKSRAGDLPKAVYAGVKKVSDAIGGEGTPGKKPDTSTTPATPPTTTGPDGTSSYTPPLPGQTDTPTPNNSY